MANGGSGPDQVGQVPMSPFRVIDETLTSFPRRLTRDEWASNNYDIGPTGYDDSPLYAWDKNFTPETLVKALERYSVRTNKGYYENLDYLMGLAWNERARVPSQSFTLCAELLD